MSADILKKLVPGVRYRNGFVDNKKLRPFYDYAKAKGDAGWSNEIADDLEEHSMHHFIDIYNRRIAVEAVAPALAQPGSSFLDAGCSSGYLLADVRRRAPQAQIVGADYFPAGLLHCHQRYPEIPLFRLDLTKCKFPDKSFNAVACLNVLEHIKHDDLALGHLHRILKPGGVAALTVPAAPHLFDLYDEIHYHERRYELRKFAEQVKSAGFQIDAANYFGVFIYPAFYAVKKRNQSRFGSLTFEEKRARAMGQIKSTSQSPLMNFVCRIEESLGRKVQYPFGIRAYIIARKRG